MDKPYDRILIWPVNPCHMVEQLGYYCTNDSSEQRNFVVCLVGTLINALQSSQNKLSELILFCSGKSALRNDMISPVAKQSQTWESG